jgi:hypothetical protein
MTARTSQKLADALRAAGLEDLAKRAEADEFHDFLSPHALPELYLDELLARFHADARCTSKQRVAVLGIRNRLIFGEFDADEQESSDWAESPAGQDAMNSLLK